MDELLEALKSEVYPCPCLDSKTGKHCSNEITMRMCSEVGEYGVELSSWPYFGGCELHAHLLNRNEGPGTTAYERTPDDGNDFGETASYEEIAWILGMYRQRKDLLKLIETA